MKALKDYSKEELEAELERRKTAPLPKLLNDPDFHELVKYMELSIKMLSTGKRVKDFKQYAFEKVLTTLYGKSFFDWANANDIWDNAE
jgi:hypothetical protein